MHILNTHIRAQKVKIELETDHRMETSVSCLQCPKVCVFLLFSNTRLILKGFFLKVIINKWICGSCLKVLALCMWQFPKVSHIKILL